MKESVTLRKRKLRTGKVSLYLDIYQQGSRSYEYLNLYILPEVSRRQREENRQTLMLAEAICAKRLVEVLNGQYGFRRPSAVPLLDYVGKVAERKSGSSRRRFKALEGILRGYERRRSMLVSDITPVWFTGFKAHVERLDLATNTKAVYVASLRHVINQAYREGYLQLNPIAGVQGRGFEDTERTYLTVDEVRRLAAAPCRDDTTKLAFLFGCLTGMRNCDIRALTWGDVHDQGGRTRIIFRQRKTHGQEYLDINDQAAALMGEKGRDDESVFRLKRWSTVRLHLFQWAASASIDKHVTFHASRHTFAVMMLELGTDIYTVSKLLGHRELSTTQVYARVLDKAKREAVDKIPDIFP